MRLPLILFVAVLGVPAAMSAPGVTVPMPMMEDAGMVGVSVSAGPVEFSTAPVLVPGLVAKNPLGPERVSTSDFALQSGMQGEALSFAAGETSVLAPLPLLPDGWLFVGLGTFGTSEGFGARFGDRIVALHSLTAAASASRVEAEPETARLGFAGDEASPLATLRPATSPAAADDARVVTRERDAAPGASVQSVQPVPRPLSTTAVVAVTVGFGAGVAALLGAALYHRIRPNATLDNETRKQIFEAVCSQPGMGVQAIAGIASVSYSTATYHLERLAAAGMIVMTPDGNRLRYYKNGGALSESERRILPLLKNAEASRVLECIAREPGTYRSEIATRLGVTTTTINWHLRRLREAGLVDEIRQGRSAHLYVTTDGARGLAALADKLRDTEGQAAAAAQRCCSVEALPSGAS